MNAWYEYAVEESCRRCYRVARVEVAIGFTGILLGWFLGVATQMWMERRTARRAGKLITTELMANASTLERTAKTSIQQWGDKPTVSTEAWKAHAMNVLAILNEDEAQRLLEAYHALGNAQRMIDFTFATFTTSKQDRDTSVNEGLRELNAAAERERERKLEGKETRPFAELEALFRHRQRDAEEAFEGTVSGLDELIESQRPFDSAIADVKKASKLLGDKTF